MFLFSSLKFKTKYTPLKFGSIWVRVMIHSNFQIELFVILRLTWSTVKNFLDN